MTKYNITTGLRAFFVAVLAFVALAGGAFPQNALAGDASRGPAYAFSDVRLRVMALERAGASADTAKKICLAVEEVSISTTDRTARAAAARAEAGLATAQTEIARLGTLTLELKTSIETLRSDVQGLVERVTELERWRADHVDPKIEAHAEAIRAHANELDGLDARVTELESYRLAVWGRAYGGLGGFSGGLSLGSGIALPIFGGGGGELQIRDDKARIWILELGGFGYVEPLLDDVGAGGHVGLGGVLNPAGKQDWSLLGGGEAMEVSSRNKDRLADANRWDVRVGIDLRKSWFIDRTRVSLGAWFRGGFGPGTEIVADDKGERYGPFTRIAGMGGATLDVAVGPKWDRWHRHHH